MKKIVNILFIMTIAMGLIGCENSNNNGDSKTAIGVIQLAEHPALDKSYDGFLAGLEEEGLVEGEDFTIDFKNAQGERANCDTIADQFINNSVDLIYAIATPSAQATAQKTKDIPIVVAAVTDPLQAGLVVSNEKPETNVTGASDLTPVEEQLDLLVQLVPDAKTIAVMYCGSEDNSIFQADLAKETIEKMGLTYKEAQVSDSSTIQQVAESLVGKVDAIYIPTDNLLAEYMTTVTNVTTENKIPCIVGEGEMAVNGGLATYGIDYYNLGMLAGKQAADIIKGKAKPEDTAIAYLSADSCELIINKEVADTIGITIPEEILKKATIIGEE